MCEHHHVGDSELVTTGVAAKAIGVDHASLVRWWKDGKVTPQLVTPGGHARWNLDQLREQLDRIQRGE